LNEIARESSRPSSSGNTTFIATSVADKPRGEAAQAHIDLESRKTTGQTILVP